MQTRILVTLALALAAAALFAQSLPHKRITLYAGFGLGGPTDLAFRTLTEAAARILGQRIIVGKSREVSNQEYIPCIPSSKATRSCA